jgi:hypothetical protein
MCYRIRQEQIGKTFAGPEYSLAVLSNEHPEPPQTTKNHTGRMILNVEYSSGYLLGILR